MPNEIEVAKLTAVVQRLDSSARVLRAWPLSGGISAKMTAVETRSDGGASQTVIVRQPGERSLKRNPNSAADEFALLQVTHSFGIASPNPRLLDLSNEIFPPYYVVDYIDGEAAFKPKDVGSFVDQFAEQLARIHSVNGDHPAIAFLPKRFEEVSMNISRVPERLDDSLNEGKIRATLQAAWPLTKRNQNMLLHGDYWPGNVLWNGDKLTAVIDWEEAEVGDPLADFAISRLDVLWLFGEDAMNRFTTKYQSLTAIDFLDLPYWDLCAALRPAGRLDEWASMCPLQGRDDVTEDTMRVQHHWFVEKALAQLACELDSR